MSEVGAEINTGEVTSANPNILHIKDRSPQTPEVLWGQWLGSLQERFRHWRQVKEPSDPEEMPPEMPNLPEKHKAIWFEIPSKYDPDLTIENERIRGIKGDNTSGVFYRPGLGWISVLPEILGKIGTYGKMVSSDPIYEGKEMLKYSKLLPIDYYVKTLSLIEPQEMQVALTDNYKQPGRIVDPGQYESAEIPEGGMATIDFKVNGVNLTIHILAEDMTKFTPDKYDTVGFGRPTPSTDKTVFVGTDEFKMHAIRNLAVDGIVDYNEKGFSFLPSLLPSEAFGFKDVFLEDKHRILQKTEDLGDRLQLAFNAAGAIKEGLGVLAGELPGLSWAGYFKSLNEDLEKGQPEYSLDDVMNGYKERLTEINKFIVSLPGEDKSKILEVVESLFMNPIATDGQLDKEKVRIIGESLDDPDKYKIFEEKMGKHFKPPGGLIEDHKEGNINMVNYYNKVIEEFYATFPQLKKSA